MESKHYSDIRFDILENYQSMSKKEMHDAVNALIEATTRAAIEKVESAIYHIKDIR